MKKITVILIGVIIFLSFALEAKTQSAQTLEQRVATLEQDVAILERLVVEFSEELALVGIKVTNLEDDVKKLR